MLLYIIENHITFFGYLQPQEINSLVNCSKLIKKNISNDTWKEVFTVNNKFDKIIDLGTHFNIIYSKTHVFSVEKTISKKKYFSISMYKFT